MDFPTQLFLNGEYANRIAAAIALEGSGSGPLVTRGLGSRRFRIVVTGPGGHSWSDAGTPNPIFVLSRALAAIVDTQLALTANVNPTLAVERLAFALKRQEVRAA